MFSAKDLVVQRTPVKKVKPKRAEDYVFGRTFTDHMLMVDWSKADGWQKPQIVPYGPFKLATSVSSLHYGISCNEGLNIVNNKSTGKLQAFRINDHLNHLLQASDKIDLPSFCPHEMAELIKQLALLDKEWITQKEGLQFYTRLVHFSTEPQLGIRTPN